MIITWAVTPKNLLGLVGKNLMSLMSLLITRSSDSLYREKNEGGKKKKKKGKKMSSKCKVQNF